MILGVTGKLVLAFVTLLLGVVLVSTVATQGLAITDKQYKADETVSIATTRLPGSLDINETAANLSLTTVTQSAWKQNDCPLTNVVVTNSSGTALVVDTDYQVELSLATIRILNTTDTRDNIADNNTLVDYNYCGDDYLNLTWGRTAVNLIGGFFALAILLVSVGLFYSVAKDTGIL